METSLDLPVNVSVFDTESGGLDNMDLVLAGFAVTVNFDYVEITSPYAQDVQFYIGRSTVIYERPIIATKAGAITYSAGGNIHTQFNTAYSTANSAFTRIDPNFYQPNFTGAVRIRVYGYNPTSNSYIRIKENGNVIYTTPAFNNAARAEVGSFDWTILAGHTLTFEMRTSGLGTVYCTDVIFSVAETIDNVVIF